MVEIFPLQVHDCIRIGGMGWGGVVAKRKARGGEMLPTLAEGRGSTALPQSSWRVHRCCGRSVFTVDTLTVDSRVA